jgi:phosphohistidine swiveling domain-containing protein
MTRKGLATKRIFNDKRPKTHVSLKGKKKESKLHKKKVLVKHTTNKECSEDGLLKVQQR